MSQSTRSGPVARLGIVTTLFLLTAMLSVPGPALVWAEAVGTEMLDAPTRAAALVAQLGHDQFATRERATEQLIQIGVPASEALEEGQKHADREIRFRSQRILRIIRDLDFQQRLEAFAAGNDSGSQTLPGWPQYRQLAGQSTDARELFVAMQKSEPQLLQAVEQGPQALARLVNQRTESLQQVARVARQQFPLGTVASLLFAVTDSEVAVSAQASQVLYTLCYQPAFSSALQNGSKKDVLRKMLGVWISRAEGPTSHQGLLLAMHHEMAEGLIPAERLLRNPDATRSHLHQYAILALAKLGSQQHAPLLESLLQDTTPIGKQRVNNNLVFETQIRDVALAALLHLAEKDPLQFGFPRIQKNPQYVYGFNSMGFENDEQRREALEKWKEGQ